LHIPLGELESKSWDDFRETHIDAVITLCDSAAARECPTWLGGPMIAHWPLNDPALHPGAADERVEFLRRLGETAHLFTDAGVILITAVSDLNDDELDMLDTLNQPSELVVVGVQDHNLFRRKPDLSIDTADREGMRQIHDLLHAKEYLPEYFL